MISDLDIWRIAKLFVDNNGAAARQAKARRQEA